MNAPILATGWEKAKFSVAQIWALVEKGVIHADAKFELLDGEVVEVSPKGPLHEQVRQIVSRWLRGFPATLDSMPETTLYLDDYSFVEPDWVVFDAALSVADLKPFEVLLAIEVADSSWRYDSGEKALAYAKAGVREYWAIHAPSKMIRVHRGPSAGGWKDVQDFAAGEGIAPLCAALCTFTL